MYSTKENVVSHVPSTPEHFVRHSTDDEDLDLVMEYVKDHSFDKTGQLRYASVPVIEDELVNDILNVIFGRKEYIRLLNNPERAEMTDIVREMIRVPTQEVLKQQLFHKILASRAYYEKFFKPMLEDNNRQKLLEFGRHLLDSHKNGTLSTSDTLELNKKLQNIAFFDRPDDKEFREMVDLLQKVFGESMNITEKGK